MARVSPLPLEAEGAEAISSFKQERKKGRSANKKGGWCKHQNQERYHIVCGEETARGGFALDLSSPPLRVGLFGDF